MYYGLLRLGFKDTDFELRDDSDGKGAYIEFWHSDKPQPSASEIQTAQDAYDAEYKTNKYQRDRKVEYDKLNQFELISDDSINGTTTHKDAILAIKEKYPKGNN
jgi:hypothetical protein